MLVKSITDKACNTKLCLLLRSLLRSRARAYQGLHTHFRISLHAVLAGNNINSNNIVHHCSGLIRPPIRSLYSKPYHRRSLLLVNGTYAINSACEQLGLRKCESELVASAKAVEAILGDNGMSCIYGQSNRTHESRCKWQLRHVRMWISLPVIMHIAP